METKDVPETGGERRLRGIPVSPGIAVGSLRFQGQAFQRPRTWPIAEGEIQAEEARFRKGLAETKTQIGALKGKLLERGGNDSEAHLFDAHQLVLEDRAVIDEVLKSLREDRLNVEAEYYKVIRRYLDSLREIDDPYLRERAIDIEDVAGRVLTNLSSDEEARSATAPADVAAHVLYARDLTPSDTVGLDRSALLGFATELGSFTSHTAIMARALGIPGVVGMEIPRGLVRSGQKVILDGYHGWLIVDPTEETRKDYHRLASKERKVNRRLDELREEPAETEDGHSVILSGNIEFGSEVSIVCEKGGEGVGLYRTEFLYFEEGRHPDEDQQARAYGQVAAAVHPHGVIIRTLDVGADKYFEDGRHAEPNPFLGWRGIRVSLAETEGFKKQLRACLRASRHGKVRVMFPMISGIEELRRAKELLRECQEELREKEVPFDEKIEVGCMIELPSAAIMAHRLAPEVDFFSVGTNDLIQYTIAVDRVNERVANLYQPGHPAILRLLRMVVQASHDHGIWVGVCGEMAGDPVFTPLLVGLGVDELSVGPNQILRVKHALRHLRYSQCQELVEELMTLDTVEEITQRCRDMAKERFGDIYQ